MYPEEQQKATPLEILGAWLHVWTPPRGVTIPPVPWRKLAIGAGIGALIVGLALAVLVPRIDTSKQQTAAADAAARAKARKANVERINAAQRARLGEAKALAPAAGASAAEVAAARAELQRRMEADMYRDARARAAAGEIKPVTAPPVCERAEGAPTTGDLGLFDCFISTTPIRAGRRNRGGALGYPFRAVVHYDTFTYAFCKAELVPGEKLVLDPQAVPLLPKACRRPGT